MDLFEEMNENEPIKKKKSGNFAKVIIIFAIIVVILIAGVLAAMMYLKSSEMKFYIDGQNTPIKSSYFEIQEDGKIYVSIQDMASLLKMQYYNGTYGKISEDTSKGYVDVAENIETVTFEANSKKIYKIHKNSSEEEYSYMYLDDSVKYINSKLYTTPEGIKKILNVSFDYNQDINIFTIEYLNTYYTGKIEEYGFNKISDEYLNQVAMKNDIIIAEKENGKKGIKKTDGTEIVGAKYDEITYMENTGDYLVKSGSKLGLINNQGKTKIDLEYDEIKVLDEDLGFYIVKQNDKYGVVNSTGNIVVHIEYDEIGIDKTMFNDSAIKNPYLLYDNCIVVKKDDKYGIYNKGGKNILPIVYDSIGCVVGTSSTRSTGNVVVIDDYEAIVIGKDNYYGIINSTGDMLIPCGLDTVYSITSEGKITYKIEGIDFRTKAPYSYDLEKYFDAVGIKKVNRGSEEKTTNETEYNTNNVNNTTNTTNSTSSTQNTDNYIEDDSEDEFEDYDEEDE